MERVNQAATVEEEFLPGSGEVLIEDPELIAAFFDHSRRDEAMAELEITFGGRVFHYQSYAGTVRDMAEVCPAFKAVLESGAAAAASWLEAHDEPKEEPAKEKPQEKPDEPEKIDEPEEKADEKPASAREVMQEKEAKSAEFVADITTETTAVETDQGGLNHVETGDGSRQFGDAGSQAAAKTVQQEVIQLPMERDAVPVEANDSGAEKTPAASDVVEATTEPVADTSKLESVSEATKAALHEYTVVREATSREVRESEIIEESTPLSAADPAEVADLIVAAPADIERPVEGERIEADESPREADEDVVVELTAYSEAREEVLPEEPSVEELIEASSDLETEPEHAETETEEYWPVRELAEIEELADDELEALLSVEDDTADGGHEGEATAEVERAAVPSSSEMDEAEIPAEPAGTNDEHKAAPFSAIEAVLEREQESADQKVFEHIKDEVTEAATEFICEEPEREADYEPETARQVAKVIEKIETLEQSKSAETCQESLQEMREELAGLLMLLGYENASEIAERLTKQYDTRTLKKFMAMLIQPLSSLERISGRTQKKTRKATSHRKYGSRVVRMAVSLTTPAQDFQAA